MIAIGDELATGKYDFVFLQEVWTTEDYERIKKRTRDVLPYSYYFFRYNIARSSFKLCKFLHLFIAMCFYYLVVSLVQGYAYFQNRKSKVLSFISGQLTDTFTRSVYLYFWPSCAGMYLHKTFDFRYSTGIGLEVKGLEW